MRRSNFTNYTHAETLIYEFRNKYFVIEHCQQGVELNPVHGTRQFPGEYCALSASLPLDCSTDEMGQEVIKAIDDFDTRPPLFESWDRRALGKALCGWLGARGIPTLEKNCRIVQVVQYFEENIFKIYPYDNNNLNPWHGRYEGREIVLPGSATPEQIGEAVIKAFSLSTYHPERKDPPAGSP